MRIRRMALIPLCLLLSLSTGCGGGGASTITAPTPDFNLAVSPSAVSSEVGGTTSAVTVTVTPQNGFSGVASVALQGIPAGVTALPAATFTVTAGGTQSVTFSVSGSAGAETSPISVLATSGALSHSAQVMLTAEAIVHAYLSGTRLYLESGTAADTARIGLETLWGGSIVEVSVNGTEFVNRCDTGREVQPSYRDGDNLNYNPTLGGDNFDQGTPTLSYALDSNSLYIKAQPLQWNPDLYGGGQGHPIPGDVLVEQTVTAVTSEAHTFKVHIKATHLGNDLHTNTGQEFPAVYTNRDYVKFVSYTGTAPWTNGPVTAVPQLPNLGGAFASYYISERWGALVNSQNQGLSVYVPSVTPYMTGFSAIANSYPSQNGPNDDPTNYFAPLGNLTIGPGFVFEGDVYVIAGDVNVARQIIYRLHQNLTIPVIFTGFGTIDQPGAGAVVSGAIPVSGWAFADVGDVAKVEVLVDGATDGTATFGNPRPDVQKVYPDAPVNVGFSYSLDTRKYHNGPHTLNVRATDTSGNIAVFPTVTIVVSN